MHRTSGCLVSRTRNLLVFSRQVERPMSTLRKLFKLHRAMHDFVLKGRNFFRDSETFEGLFGMSRNFVSLHKTIEDWYTMYKTSERFMELSERLVSTPWNVWKCGEPKKILNGSHKAFCIVPNLKWIGARMVNLHRSAENLFFYSMECNTHYKWSKSSRMSFTHQTRSTTPSPY